MDKHRYQIDYFFRPGEMGRRRLWEGECPEDQAVKNWEYFVSTHTNAELRKVTTTYETIMPPSKASPPSASEQGCEYDNQRCPKRSDDTHCAHWWDGGPCCSCGHKGTDAVAKQWLESIDDDGYRTDSERYAARHLLEMLAAQPFPPTTQEKAP